MMGFKEDEKAFGKMTKEIYDRAEERFTDDMEKWTAERLKKNPPPKKDEG